MPLSLTVPFLQRKPSTTQDMVFTVLTNTYPLSLIELQHELRKRYARVISFQSVRKAVLALCEAGVLERTGRTYAIRKEWIRHLLSFGGTLQRQYLTKRTAKDVVAAGDSTLVYTLPSMAEADIVWNDIITETFADPAQPRVFTFTGSHFWFVLVNLAPETALMRGLLEKGVEPYLVSYGDTPLDAWAVRYYRDLGAHAAHVPRPNDFPAGLHIGTYGDVLVKMQYPEGLARRMDAFYARYNRIEDARLPELVEVATLRGEFQLTVIRDPQIAHAFRESVFAKFA